MRDAQRVTCNRESVPVGPNVVGQARGANRHDGWWPRLPGGHGRPAPRDSRRQSTPTDFIRLPPRPFAALAGRRPRPPLDWGGGDWGRRGRRKSHSSRSPASHMPLCPSRTSPRRPSSCNGAAEASLPSVPLGAEDMDATRETTGTMPKKIPEVYPARDGLAARLLPKPARPIASLGVHVAGQRRTAASEPA